MLHLLARLLSRPPRWPLAIPEDLFGGHFSYSLPHLLTPLLGLVDRAPLPQPLYVPFHCRVILWMSPDLERFEPFLAASGAQFGQAL